VLFLVVFGVRAFGMQTLGLETTPVSVPWPTYAGYLNQDAQNEQGAYWGLYGLVGSIPILTLGPRSTQTSTRISKWS